MLGSTPNPDAGYMAQAARRLTDAADGFLAGHQVLICDRDGKWTEEFRGLLDEAGVRIVLTPVQAPNANAHAERFVRSIREECLDQLILFGERHLIRAVDEFVAHYHRERNHQGLGKRNSDEFSDTTGAMIRRHKVRLVVSFGAIVASIMVPFLTFRFATELSIVSIEGIAALWRSAQVPLLDLGIYGAITGLSVLFGAVIGIRFWNHFLTRVVPQLLGSRRIDAASGAVGREALPQWLRASPAWWVVFVVPGYASCTAFGAGLLGVTLLVPALIAFGHIDIITTAWHVTMRPGGAGYTRGLVALLLSLLTGPLVAGIYVAIGWARAVRENGFR